MPTKDEYLSLPTYYNDSFNALPTPVSTTLPATIGAIRVGDIKNSDISIPDPPSSASEEQKRIASVRTGIPGISMSDVISALTGSGIDIFMQTTSEGYSEIMGVIQHHDDSWVFQFAGATPPRISITAIVRETFSHPHKSMLQTAYDTFLRASRAYALGYVSRIRYGNREIIGYMTAISFSLSAETPTDYNTGIEIAAIWAGNIGDVVLSVSQTGSLDSGDKSLSGQDALTGGSVNGDL